MVAGPDMEAGQRALEERWAEGLPADVVAACELSIDLDAEEANCPACLTPFAPGRPYCPGCGLRVG